MNAARRQRAWADINLQALRANLEQVRVRNPHARIVPVIKSNAYGHGMEPVASALADAGTDVACLGVATMDEAVALGRLGSGRRVLLMQGFADLDQLCYLAEAGFEFVVHADYQVALLKRFLQDNPKARGVGIWLKLDTGMHRLGLGQDEMDQAFRYLCGNPAVGSLTVLSHLAWADEPENPKAIEFTRRQLDRFAGVATRLRGGGVAFSLAASAGILAWPESHFDYLRPGIMLYGGSPLAGCTGPQLGLQPVMTLRARLMAIRTVGQGDSIGYGATFTCDHPMRIGVVSIGYGDGYPRSAPTGTPVLLKTRGGSRRARLVGRVSMDMITVDLAELPDAEVGDEVVLWGEGLPADEVARFAGTVSYELFCQVTRRVPFIYS